MLLWILVIVSGGVVESVVVCVFVDSVVVSGGVV